MLELEKSRRNKLSLNKSIDELNKFLLKEKIGKIIPNIFLRNKMEEYPKDTIYAGHHHLEELRCPKHQKKVLLIRT